MWVPRTSEEELKWRTSAAENAESRGWMAGLGGWGIANVVLAIRWTFRHNSATAAGQNPGGSFWMHLLVMGIITSPVIFIAYRFESRKSLKNDLTRTICPKCDIAAENNANARCQCGGTFVPASSLRWVED